MSLGAFLESFSSNGNVEVYGALGCCAGVGGIYLDLGGPGQRAHSDKQCQNKEEWRRTALGSHLHTPGRDGLQSGPRPGRISSSLTLHGQPLRFSDLICWPYHHKRSPVIGIAVADVTLSTSRCAQGQCRRPLLMQVVKPDHEGSRRLARGQISLVRLEQPCSHQLDPRLPADRAE